MAKIRGAESSFSFKPESLRGHHGFFCAAQSDAGPWWLVDPSGQPFFAKAVAAVNRHGRAGPAPEQRGPYAQAVDDAYGFDDEAAFAHAALGRLRQWKFTTLGPWSDAAALWADGMYATAMADFRQAGGPVIHGHGSHLPDVFDPGWAAACDARAVDVTAPWAGRPDLIGYYTDPALGWGEVRAGRPSLLQVCLSLEPGFFAYHAAWEFVLAPHGNDLSALAREWRVNLPNKEVIRQRTLAEQPLATVGYLRDHERFTREFAHRYFTTTAAALRRYDADHLVLGCRFAQPPGEAVLAECVYPHVDVVSWQCHAPEFSTQADMYARSGRMPLLLTSVGLTNDRFQAVKPNPGSGPTRLERMLRDGRKTLTRACTHPAVVGYEWARWADAAEAQPPFGAGLVHVDDREAVEHTELLAQINARAEGLRRRVSVRPKPRKAKRAG